MYLFMPAKSQFKFQIEEDLRERLNNAANRLGRDTAQEVVEEILTIYFPVWLAVADSTRRAVEYQTQKTLEIADRNQRNDERQANGQKRLGKVVGHISPGAPTRQDAQRMIDEAKVVEKYPRKRTIDHVEPVPDERIAYVRNLGELTDERKQKPIRRKAGRK
jgi:predicted DNA-binding protein